MSSYRSFPKEYSHLGDAVLLVVMYILVVCDFFSNFCIWEGFIISGHALTDWHVLRLFINHFWVVHISFPVAFGIITIVNEQNTLIHTQDACTQIYIYIPTIPKSTLQSRWTVEIK